MSPVDPLPPHLDTGDDQDAKDILLAARRRALGSSPRLRRASAVLWSSFLGASCSLVVLLLAPEEWTHLSPDLGRLTAVFFAQWALMTIPACMVCSLTAPLTRGSRQRRR